MSKVEIFLIPKVNKAKIEAKQKELIEKELKDCTFSPQTLNYKGPSKNPRVTHGDRNIDLYSMKK